MPSLFPSDGGKSNQRITSTRAKNSGVMLLVLNFSKILAGKFPSEFRISPSEFGEGEIEELLDTNGMGYQVKPTLILETLSVSGVFLLDAFPFSI